MSPVGGVGINLAIKDAVASANLLAEPLRAMSMVTEAMLARIQARREFPTRVTQFLQVQAHKGLQSIFRNPGPAVAPWQMKAVLAVPGIKKVAARVVGVGVFRNTSRGSSGECPVPLLKRIAIGAGLVAASVVIGTRLIQAQRRKQYTWGESRAGF